MLLRMVCSEEGGNRHLGVFLEVEKHFMGFERA
jgi:hypothetical protein